MHAIAFFGFLFFASLLFFFFFTLFSLLLLLPLYVFWFRARANGPNVDATDDMDDDMIKWTMIHREYRFIWHDMTMVETFLFSLFTTFGYVIRMLEFLLHSKQCKSRKKLRQKQKISVICIRIIFQSYHLVWLIHVHSISVCRQLLCNFRIEGIHVSCANRTAHSSIRTCPDWRNTYAHTHPLLRSLALYCCWNEWQKCGQLQPNWFFFLFLSHFSCCCMVHNFFFHFQRNRLVSRDRSR